MMRKSCSVVATSVNLFSIGSGHFQNVTVCNSFISLVFQPLFLILTFIQYKSNVILQYKFAKTPWKHSARFCRY